MSSRRAKSRFHPGAFLLGTALLAFSACQCGRPFVKASRGRAGTYRPRAGETIVTGYCNCSRCCGWERSWFGLGGPVYSSGPMRGKPKRVGVTSSGKIARRGTVAADLSVYPYGTKLKIPGYGIGTVEDIGGAIKGDHIDIWFPTHEEALRWGWRRLRVERVR